MKFYFVRGDDHVDLSAFAAVVVAAVVVAAVAVVAAAVVATVDVAAVVVATVVTKPSTFTTSLPLHLLQQPRFFSLPSSL